MAASGAMAALRDNHPALPAGECRAVHCAMFRLRWKGLRPVPLVEGCTSVVRDILRRARGGGFYNMPRARSAAGDSLCHLCDAIVVDGSCWTHAVLCEGRGAALADPVEFCTAALRRAAGRRVATKLAAAAGKLAQYCKQMCIAAHDRKAAELNGDAAALPPPPAAPSGRRVKPPDVEAATALRAAAGAVRGYAALVADARLMLAGGVAQQGAALAAVLPTADARRGDGALLSALGVAAAERAAAYLRAVSPHAAPEAAQAASAAAAVLTVVATIAA